MMFYTREAFRLTTWIHIPSESLGLRPILSALDSSQFRTALFQEDLFIADINLMFSDCYYLNRSDSPYYEMAYNLNKTFMELCKQHFPGSTLMLQLPKQKPNVTKH